MMMLWLASAAALGAWALLLLALAVRTRGPSVEPGPPTGAFADESPAVVDLITGDWQLCSEATSATLLDLAARGAVQIEEVGPELSLVRLRRADGLNAYEQLVYDHVSALARDGVVATGALAEGSRDLGRWWKSFRKKVIADARARGLSQARWSRAQATLLTAAAAVPAGVIGLAVTFSDDEHGGGLGAFVIAMGLLVSLAGKLNGERGTELGARAAAHWLGVRAHLANARFPEQPAAAVTIWGRPLAYAAALGLAPRAVTSLPVSVPADDRRAWSDYGGMWHAVEVHYPRRLLSGMKPLHAMGRGLVAAFFLGFWTWLAQVVLGAFDLWPEELVQPVWLAVALTCAALPLVRILGGVTWMEGQVVRLRRTQKGGSEDSTEYVHWCAIDEGTGRQVQAFGVDERHWGLLAEGAIVRVRANRRLGWISEVEVLRGPKPGGGYSDAHDHHIDAPRNLGEVRESRPPG